MTNTQYAAFMLALESIDAKLGRIADACERADERMRTAGVGSLESQATDGGASLDAERPALPKGLCYGPGVSGGGKKRGRK